MQVAGHGPVCSVVRFVCPLFLLAEKEGRTPVTLKTGFMFDLKDDDDATWDAVVSRIEAQLLREGFKGKKSLVWGTKVRPNRRRRGSFRLKSPRQKKGPSESPKCLCAALTSSRIPERHARADRGGISTAQSIGDKVCRLGGEESLEKRTTEEDMVGEGKLSKCLGIPVLRALLFEKYDVIQLRVRAQDLPEKRKRSWQNLRQGKGEARETCQCGRKQMFWRRT